jgi:hypothetical protein
VLLMVAVAMLLFGTNLTIGFFGNNQTTSIEEQLTKTADIGVAGSDQTCEIIP